MIPNKIYIAETPNKLIEIWSEEPIEPKPYITEHEYIRKDALMEWLESRINLSDGGFVNGLVCFAYKDVIKHLNEM